jgi:HECT-domain (ubiquitin-transferase)
MMPSSCTGLSRAIKINNNNNVGSLNKNLALFAHQLMVRFQEEGGVGAGVKREWYTNLSSHFLNPEYGLFQHVGDNSGFVVPSPDSNVHEKHLEYFQLCGWLLGIILLQKEVVAIKLASHFVHTYLLGLPLTYHHLQAADSTFHRSLMYLMLR